MRIIVIGSPELSTALAAHLHLDHVREPIEIEHDDFVLDGTSLDLAQVRMLDVVLRARAAEVEAVLWVQGGDPAVIDHYSGRVLELDDAAETLDAALAGLRELLLAA